MRSKSAEPMARALAGALDHKQAAVDRASLGDKLGQVLEPRQDAEVPGLVDDGLDPKRATVFEVLLDP